MIPTRFLERCVHSILKRGSTSARNGVLKGPAKVQLSSLVAARPRQRWSEQPLSQEVLNAAAPLNIREFSAHPDRKFQAKYTVYGEECALNITVIPPEFRKYGASLFALDASKRGRFLFEWTPRKNNDSARYDWGTNIRYALSPEEAGTLIVRMASKDGYKVVRRSYTSGDRFDMGDGRTPEKIFYAAPSPDGSVDLHVDFESEGKGGQRPPNSKEAVGPLSIALTAGEYQVVKSIIEYTLPHLVGWSMGLDSSIERSLSEATPADNGRYTDQSSYGDVPF